MLQGSPPSASLHSGTMTVPEDYNMSCRLKVPAMDYVTSPYYDSGTRKITLPSNSLNISLYYNDGYSKASVSLQRVLGDVVIDVIGHCGEGGCEDWLGESQASCCRDCGCSKYRSATGGG